MYVCMYVCMYSNYLLSSMTYTIRPEDKFDGKEHFDAWKFRIMMFLEENDVKQFFD